MEQTREWIDWTAQGIEALAVLVMVVFIVVGTVRWLMEPRAAILAGYSRYRVVLGKSLLVGLELLVAADIIRERRPGAHAARHRRVRAAHDRQDLSRLDRDAGSRRPLALAG